MPHRAEMLNRPARSTRWQVEWAFLASWRGQLVITGIAFLIGGIIFVLREPYAKFRQKRREAISKVRERELISMEMSDAQNDEKEKRGREKRKDGKKRKGSLLRPPVALSESSAAETSPAPASAPLPKTKRVVSTKDKENSNTGPTSMPRNASLATVTLLQPAPEIISSDPRPDRSKPLDPADIPLPPSPMAGPSRLSFSQGEDQESIDGDSGNTSESASNHHISDAPDKTRPEPMNFSIIPEEGYLPAQAQIGGKKKKRKGRAAPPALPSLERRASSSNLANGPGSPSVPLTPSGRARKASLTRPANADLEALLTEREGMIESLRAEVGLAKAEESKARESLARATTTVDRLQGDYERARKASQRVDHESRRREGELNVRLTQLSAQYATALHRISVLESVMHESGHSFPPVSPGLPPQGHSPAPIPIQYMQSVPSPMPPSSPFGNGFGPSPRAVSAGFMPYPSPGMYPSPMLHPHYHSHSPSPFRRASSAGLEESLAGPLTPGHPSPMRTGGSGSYPFDLGIMPPPSAPSQSSGNGPLSAADLRRLSIESSVLKKKKDEVKTGSEDGDPAKSLDPLPDTDETVQGLGVGEMAMERSVKQSDDPAGGSGSGSPYPSSPSPPTRTSVLLTPASSRLFHQAVVRDAESQRDFGRDISHVDLREIKMVPDGEKGTVYYTTSRPTNLPLSDGDATSDAASACGGNRNAAHVNGKPKEGDSGCDGKEDVGPMFASLAHTPQQVREIKQMRDKVIQARESRSSSQSRGSEGSRGAA